MLISGHSSYCLHGPEKVDLYNLSHEIKFNSFGLSVFVFSQGSVQSMVWQGSMAHHSGLSALGKHDGGSIKWD